MQLVLLVLSTVYLAVIKAWWISWVGTGTLFFVVILFRLGVSFSPKKTRPSSNHAGPEAAS